MKPKSPKNPEDEEIYSPVKHLFIRLGYIALGIAITLPVLNETGPLRFLGLSLLFSGYHFFRLIFTDIRFLVEDWFENQQKKHVKRKDRNHVKKISRHSSLFFLACLVLMISQFRSVENTISAMDLFWKSVAAGLLVATLLLIRFFRKADYVIPGSYFYGMVLQFGFGAAILSATLAITVNRYFPTGPEKTRFVVVESKAIGGKRHNKHWLFLKFGDHTERFQVSGAFFDSCGDAVKIVSRKGVLGYEYILNLH